VERTTESVKQFPNSCVTPKLSDCTIKTLMMVVESFKDNMTQFLFIFSSSTTISTAENKNYHVRVCIHAQAEYGSARKHILWDRKIP
jgi:hypothetical protein